MTVADDVLRALSVHTAGMADAEPTTMLRKRHRQINQVCQGLADQGLIIRGHSAGVIVNTFRADALAPVREPLPENSSATWSGEGNVQIRVATYLAATGWSIVRVADTALRQRGVDIIGQRDGQRLVVEAKGSPATTYARSERAGQPKPTQPTTQAGVWFAEGLTTLIRRGADPGSRPALARPEMRRYRALLAETGWALDRLDTTVYLVTAGGTVAMWDREN
jgi:hypothetical protein